MKQFANRTLIVIAGILLMAACNKQPRVIDGEPIRASGSIVNPDHSVGAAERQDPHSDGHMVVVNEVLDTEKYSYLNVSEDGEKYWIAIPRAKVQVGSTFFYRGGLLKKNFRSQEYDRVFETIYLVSDIIAHPNNSGQIEEPVLNTSGGNSNDTKLSAPAEGSIKLSELFSEREKYEGQLVQVTGKCVKVNLMIMGRNWIHIQDGSGDGLDLTITTSERVKVDDQVTFEGTIALNKDFGAGYRYDIIMELALLK